MSHEVKRVQFDAETEAEPVYDYRLISEFHNQGGCEFFFHSEKTKSLIKARRWKNK